MVNGGTLVIAGATGSGKTFIAKPRAAGILDFFQRRHSSLIIEDSNEIVLNGWMVAQARIPAMLYTLSPGGGPRWTAAYHHV